MPLNDPATTDAQLERSLAKSNAGIDAPVEESGPVYRVVGDSKIPVSKAAGVLWAARKDQGMAARKTSETCWDEAIKYYDNDQSSHRTSRDGTSGNNAYTQQLGSQYSETENVVFANTCVMVPMLYAKNPNVTVTYESDTNAALGQCLEHLGNKLISMKNSPGLGLKPKMRRTVLTALLTNNAFVKIGWTDKQDSSDQALRDLEALTEELQNAKTVKQIREVEGKIKALEEKVDLLSSAGPWMRVMLPDRIVVDPTSTEPDGSDANWMIEWDYLPTDYINAVYASKDGEQFKSIYEPTHIMLAGNNDNMEATVNNFRLIPDEGELKAATYGYRSQAQLDAASYTKVWYVWDKTTRRVLMFADNYWKWPIWVWDDPLKLPRFFPYFRLWFHETVNSHSPKGEITYYLDQQDKINEINSEIRTARKWVRRNIFYNKSSISQEDVELVLKGPDGTARGVTLPEGQSLRDVIFSADPPAIKFPELFDTTTAFAAIDRVTGLNDALRGGQFKTNTTNGAVQAYQQNTDVRVEERVDLIEDFIGDVMWNILVLCQMKMSQEDVVDLLGQTLAAPWQQIADPRDFERKFNARVEGGSIAKPNSQQRKQQAVQLAQAMGQFANAAPGIVVVMMKMMQRAFNDSVVIGQDDWQMILQTMEQSLQKAGSGPNGEPQGQQQRPGAPNGGPPQTDEQMKANIKAQIAQMPPAAQQELEKLVQSGMPAGEALKQIQAELDKATQQQ